MRSTFSFLLALSLLASLSSCGRYHESIGDQACGTQWVTCPPLPKIQSACEPNEDEELDRRLLDDCGERYLRRDDYSEDISQFRPKPDEPYEAYFTRVMNTLTIQEYNIESLEQAIEEKEKSVSQLNSQLTTMLQSENEMRLSLSSFETEQVETPLAAGGRPQRKRQKKSTHTGPFSIYVVQQDDTLQKISHQAYGTHTGWIAIYRFNMNKMLYGPNRIEVGTTLYIPNVNLMSL